MQQRFQRKQNKKPLQECNGFTKIRAKNLKRVSNSETSKAGLKIIVSNKSE
jgi:hypothetical protein